MNLLSVDFDYFFPTKEYNCTNTEELCLFDWGHNEGWSPKLLDALWYIRASAFLRLQRELPYEKVPDKFWDRFNISKNAKLFIADSHSQAAHPKVTNNITDSIVSNIDAHHDCGFDKNIVDKVINEQSVDCSNWCIYYILRGNIINWLVPDFVPDKVVEKQLESMDSNIVTSSLNVYRDNLPETEYSRVFLCRSSSWVPPWMDDDFFALVDSYPGKKIFLSDVEHRNWDISFAEKMAEDEKEALSKQSSA